jgi:hypothetical protein
MAADANDLGFELLPADDEGSAPADDLAAAAASALEDPGAPVLSSEPPADPSGYTWPFDFEQGRFVRYGQSPARVTGVEAIKQRCLMAVYSARYAHPIFSDEFGVEQPQRGIGSVGPEAREAADDWRAALRDALLVFDDVTDVQVTPSYDPIEGVIILSDLVVTTNEEVELSFSDIRITPLPEA